MQRNIILTGLLIMLLCCSKAQSLKGTEWVLIKISDQESNATEKVEFLNEVTLIFTTDSTYTGEACNTYFGSYRAHANDFSMQKPSSSRKSCGEAYNKAEKNLYEKYAQVKNFSIQSNKLVLSTSLSTLYYIRR